jgi:hypothetical protein
MNAPDLEALLVALVLAPATYSRNRFFSMYTDPEVRRVRRRASMIRSIVRHLAHISLAAQGDTLTIEPVGGGCVALTYLVPSIGLRRTSILDELELALVRFAVARAPKGPPVTMGATPGPTQAGSQASPRTGSAPIPPAAAALPPDDPDRLRIEEALVRLAPRAVPPSAPPV